MAVISEIPDESNGGHPNKKPEEEVENRNEKPEEEENRKEKPKEKENPNEKPEEEEEENRNKKPEEEAENPNEKPKKKVENQKENPEEEVNTFPSLHIAIAEICVARVRRCDYPALSLTSTAFRRLIASPELYDTRSRLGTTECVLYALIIFPPRELPSWYILYRNIPRKIPLRLLKLDSLPPMPFGSAVVTIGPEIYVIGGSIGHRNTSDVMVIDFRYHTHRSLPRMRRVRLQAAAGVIDGKIYVIGGCKERFSDWIEVFDPKEERWSSLAGPYPYACWRGEFLTYAVMEEKIYLLDTQCIAVYEPKLKKWYSWVTGHPLRDTPFWQTSSCVVDDLLYTLDPLCILGHPIIVYDPKENVMKPVKGVGDLPNDLHYYESKMANFGGKLMILGGNHSLVGLSSILRKEFWCVEVALEKRQGGEIWGKVESIKDVFSSDYKFPYIELCRAFTL